MKWIQVPFLSSPEDGKIGKNDSEVHVCPVIGKIEWNEISFLSIPEDGKIGKIDSESHVSPSIEKDEKIEWLGNFVSFCS